jgi:hypothetical protein
VRIKQFAERADWCEFTRSLVTHDPWQRIAAKREGASCQPIQEDSKRIQICPRISKMTVEEFRG